MSLVLTPDLILEAYRLGLFPMAEHALASDVRWICPEERGQLSIHKLHIPKRLKRHLRQMNLNGKPYDIRLNHNFKTVIQACAEQTDERNETWINSSIIDAYTHLQERGHAHSVECWRNDELIGGLYGISIGGAFFGESMFSRQSNASKIALVHLSARLWKAGYSILDTQFMNSHLEQFGAYELSHCDYIKKLTPALSEKCDFLFKEPDEHVLINDYLDFLNASDS